MPSHCSNGGEGAGIAAGCGQGAVFLQERKSLNQVGNPLHMLFVHFPQRLQRGVRRDCDPTVVVMAGSNRAGAVATVSRPRISRIVSAIDLSGVGTGLSTSSGAETLRDLELRGEPASEMRSQSDWTFSSCCGLASSSGSPSILNGWYITAVTCAQGLIMPPYRRN